MGMSLVSILIASLRIFYSVCEIWRGGKLGVEALRLSSPGMLAEPHGFSVSL